MKIKPLYGSFSFGNEVTIDILIERLSQISAHFLEDRIFNSYLKTTKGESHYGLEYEELKALYAKYPQKISTISTSSSTEKGKGLNINIRFAKGSGEGDGQFVIVAGSKAENEEIRDMLLGIWEPRPEPEIQEEVPPTVEPAEEALSEQLGDLLQEIAEAGEKKAKAAPIMGIMGQPVPTEPKTYAVYETKFIFNKEIQVDTLVDFIYDLFIQYLDDATFDLRILTYGGDLMMGLKADELRENLYQLKGDIHKLYIRMDGADGKKLELDLSYSPLPLEADSELRVCTDSNEDMASLIISQLSMPEGDTGFSLEATKETFNFDPDTFVIEDLLKLVAEINQDFLKSAQAMAFLSSKEGDHYHDVVMEQLKDLFYLYQRAVSMLSLYLTRPITGQTINIVFEFGTGSGSFSLLLGDNMKEQRLSDLLWERLRLKTYNVPRKQEVETSALVQQGGILVRPIFKRRRIELVKNSCLVVVPSEGEDAKSVWKELQHALTPAGFTCWQATSIFEYVVLEKIWDEVSKADFILADVSEKSPEVFYILGIAHTLGKKVVILTQRSGDIPFDFKKYRHVIYEPTEAGFLNMRKEIFAYLKEN